jgi:hypothetical protein
MLEMSDLASSLKDVVSGLKDGLLIDLQRHVFVKGRDAGDERPGPEPGRFHVWLEDGLHIDLQRHVVAKGRDVGDERPGPEPGRFHVWARGRAPYRSTKTCCCKGQRCWR